MAPAAGIDQTGAVSGRGEAEIGVVLPKEQAVFGAAGEHAVGFADALGDEVVDEDADVGFGAVEDERRIAFELEGGIGARHQSLGGGFLVAGGAVDLAGKVKGSASLGFEGGEKLGAEDSSRIRRRNPGA